jgi:photosystem II stability/assembly factor-like uncharacterized protein
MKTTNILGICLAVLLNTGVKAQWEITSGPPGPNVTALTANENLLIGAVGGIGSNPGGFLTTDNGDNWLQTGNTLTSIFYSIAIDASTGNIYAGGNGSFFQSFDSGESYTNTNNGLPGNIVRDVLVDGDDLLVSNQGIYLSTNDGFNWALVSPDFTSTKMDKSGNQILVGSMTSGVFYSDDNGNSWSNFTEGLPSNINDVKILGTNFLLATNFGVYISEDSGTTWTLTNLTEPSSCFYQIGATVFSGNDNGLFLSTDGGNTWLPENDGLSNLTVFSLAANDTYLFAGTTGFVFRRPLSEFEILTTSENSQTKDVNIYPNPTRDLLTISHPQWVNAEIEVRNLLGQVVLKASSAFNEITVDLSQNDKGIYVVSLTGPNNEVSIQKVVID